VKKEEQALMVLKAKKERMVPIHVVLLFQQVHHVVLVDLMEAYQVT
jgi:hypothetical protein